MYLNDSYQNNLRDPRFERMLTRYYADPNEDYAIDPWDRLYNRNDCVETVLFPELETEKPEVAQVRHIIEEKCTESQQDLIYKYFGERKTLTEICKAEAQKTGRLPTLTAVFNRKKKIIDKVAKSLGVKRENKLSKSKSEQDDTDDAE